MHLLGSLLGLSFGWLGLTFVLFAIPLGVAAAVLWIWMLVEVLTRETDDGNNRLIWALVIIFTRLIGALIYLFVRRPERIRKLGR